MPAVDGVESQRDFMKADCVASIGEASVSIGCHVIKRIVLNRRSGREQKGHLVGVVKGGNFRVRENVREAPSLILFEEETVTENEVYFKARRVPRGRKSPFGWVLIKKRNRRKSEETKEDK